jgi:phosphoribosyl-ATP pyrophosphohydrolase/phosphoribosyl-AMP cyclohydrolase
MVKTLKFDRTGLIPAVVQDANTLQVLMVAWMNEESLRRTRETAETHFWSRSRQELWHKGATSGNVQHVQEIRVDCDGDTLLVLVDPAGPACHTGTTSCFSQVSLSSGAKTAEK